jgi:regulator of protease activity HflC (stomatin/prohibitin superfamily)
VVSIHNDVSAQINSYVFDTVRAKVPQIILDDLFERKDDIARAVKEELNETMKAFGFEKLRLNPESQSKPEIFQIFLFQSTTGLFPLNRDLIIIR